ncbi:MAG: hypothetical protein V1850_03965 [Candidatus Bathyarchaeota archaeon]
MAGKYFSYPGDIPPGIYLPILVSLVHCYVTSPNLLPSYSPTTEIDKIMDKKWTMDKSHGTILKIMEPNGRIWKKNPSSYRQQHHTHF